MKIGQHEVDDDAFDYGMYKCFSVFVEKRFQIGKQVRQFFMMRRRMGNVTGDAVHYEDVVMLAYSSCIVFFVERVLGH